jgi:uncharacterized protein YjbJ (UPF0337 family)
MAMDNDRLTGTAKNVVGKVEEGFGHATGNMRHQMEGKARQVEGDLQDLYGQAKDAAANAAQTVRESAGDVEDFVRNTIEQRPYTTAAVALAVGFLRLSRRVY